MTHPGPEGPYDPVRRASAPRGRREQAPEREVTPLPPAHPLVRGRLQHRPQRSPNQRLRDLLQPVRNIQLQVACPIPKPQDIPTSATAESDEARSQPPSRLGKDQRRAAMSPRQPDGTPSGRRAPLDYPAHSLPGARPGPARSRGRRVGRPTRRREPGRHPAPTRWRSGPGDAHSSTCTPSEWGTLVGWRCGADARCGGRVEGQEDACRFGQADGTAWQVQAAFREDTRRVSSRISGLTALAQRAVRLC